MFRFYRSVAWGKARISLYRFIVPLLLFQLVRTIALPTTFDVMITAVLVCLTFCFYMEWL